MLTLSVLSVITHLNDQFKTFAHLRLLNEYQLDDSNFITSSMKFSFWNKTSQKNLTET